MAKGNLLKSLIFISANLFFGISPSWAARSDKKCQSAYQSWIRKAGVSDSTAVRQEWDVSKFSDPRSHNEESFRYIVHMINYTHSPRQTFKYFQSFLGKTPCSWVSASLIDQAHTGTYGEFGFILKVPAENILLAATADIGSSYNSTNTDPGVFYLTLHQALSRVGPLKTPSEILTGTDTFKRHPFFQVPWYNEVLVQGMRSKPISIVGILVAPDQNRVEGVDERLREQQLAELLQLANLEKLPIVYVKAAKN